MNLAPKENIDRIIPLLDEAYACRTNNLKRSIELAKKALALSRKSGKLTLIAQSLNLLSLFSMIMGEFENSLRMADEAIKYYEELKDEKGIANAKYNIAGVYYKTDNYHLGLVNLVDCIKTYRKFNDYHNLSRSHKSLGTIYEYFGDEKNAIQTYEDAITSAKKAGDLNLESNTYNPLSGIYLKQKNIEKASEIIERAITIKKQTGDIRGLAFALYGRGKINLVEKRFAEAENDLNTAINIHQEMGETLGLGMAYHKIAFLYVEMGLLNKAKTALKKGIEFSEEYNIIMVRYKCYLLLYRVYKLENDPVNAIKYLELYHQLKDTVINTQTLKIIENYELLSQMESIEKEARVQVEKAEIIEKKNLAEQSARIKQDFLSTMSHEIRTPLNAVITIASLLSENENKEEQQLVDSLKFASNNLLMIVNDILDFTKLDAGKTTLEMHSVNFRSLLENINRTYETMAKEKGLDLRLNIDEAVAQYYELDDTKVSQILGNLITNAIKFTQTGNVEVSVKKLTGKTNTDRLHFEVTDTGIGIPENYQESIFESFSQAQSIKTRKQGGSGLGLAIVKKLVKLYDSDIGLSSVLGKGSVFYFDLNLKTADSPARTRTRQSDYLNGKTVLLAEDNNINAMVIGKLLSNWKMVAEHAKNGLEAVEKSKLKTFDYILMDIHMPEMDGFEATRNILNVGNPNVKTPIFALTADITAESQEEYHTFFTGFLRKPIEIDKLFEALIGAV
jgi:signal transduction histidine kinase/CheY-like chemotaxis protein/Tfp pilus assembly protein PilF